jgi:hypothetical protein
VVLGVAAYTLSTYANRLTQAPLDAPFQAFAWNEPDQAVTLGGRTASRQAETV